MSDNRRKGDPKKMTRGERLLAGWCPNCAERGPHYVPPSGGGTMPGFFMCDSIDPEPDKK